MEAQEGIVFCLVHKTRFHLSCILKDQYTQTLSQESAGGLVKSQTAVPRSVCRVSRIP